MTLVRHGWHSIALALGIFLLFEFKSREVMAQEEVGPDYSAPLNFNNQPIVVEPPSYFDIAWEVAKPRKGAAQFTWLAGGGNDGLEIGKTDISFTSVAPFPWMEETYLAITPGLSVQTLNGPTGVELPSELYQGTLNFTLMKQLSPETEVMVGLAPSVASDFQGGGDEAFRFMAFGNVSWQSSPTTTLLSGIVVTGRDDVPVLPMVGLVWTPSEDWQYELTFPRPRISHRMNCFAGPNEDWFYVAGELGGGTWAVDRNGRNDELTLRDFRLVLGWEQRGEFGIRPQVEVGYVFGRNVEYESDDYEFQPSDTVMLRAGLSF